MQKMEELLKQAEILSIERRPEACLGCGFEHSCSLHGCAVIKALIAMVDAGQECEAKLAAYVANGPGPEDVEKIYGLLAEVADDRNCHFDFVTRCVLKVGREIKEKNAPLTLDELKEHLSKGHPYEIEPLYIVFDPPMPIDFGPRWRDAFNLSQMIEHCADTYGEMWTVYRRKPEGGAW